MNKEVMLDASEWEGFGRLAKAGWRVSVSERLWDRYVRVPEQADSECETARRHDLLSRLLSALEATEPELANPFTGFGFRMDALLNDPDRAGDATVATIEVGVFPTIGRQHLPRLLVCLLKETVLVQSGMPGAQQ